MPDYSLWKQTLAGAINPADRAVDLWNKIQRDPDLITITRDDIPLSEQTVLVTYDNPTSRYARGATGAATRRSVIIFGVVGHPDENVPDIDIQRDDMFNHDGVVMRVTDVMQLPGEIQAAAEAVS